MRAIDIQYDVIDIAIQELVDIAIDIGIAIAIDIDTAELFCSTETKQCSASTVRGRRS